MIYVATAHINSPRWANIQQRFLQEHMGEPFEVYASLEGMSPEDVPWDKTFEHKWSHPGKLNLLAAEINQVAADDDLIMFLDGDAFPIADPMPLIRSSLERAPILALQRLENAGDPQPHPAFCVMEVRTWRAIHGDWSSGYTWTGGDGLPKSDVGGNMIRLLELAQVEWTPLHRTNTVNLHPVWFGVYGDIVYHHGAGFRPAISRHDLLSAPRKLPVPKVPGIRHLVRVINARREYWWERRHVKRATLLSESIIAEAIADFDFYRRFLTLPE